MQKLFPIVLLALTATALAVSTSHWTQTNETDFKTGTLHNVVATNLGDLKLSRAVNTLLEEDPKVSMVTALAQGKYGVIYAGTAPLGLLLQVADGKVSTVATIPDAVSISALLAEPNGGLLIGVSGAKGRVLRIDKPGDKPHEIFSEKDVQYVWSLVELSDGSIYAATGPNGQLFLIRPDGTHEEVYKSDENNLTALVSDGKDFLYIGTDPDGLVVRLDRKTKNAFVLYNADEEEITALALDAKGNLYAATGQTVQPLPPQPETPAKEQSGRPEPSANNPLPSEPPKPPSPPKPAPPGEPAPIPQKSSPAFWPGHRTSFVEPVLLVTDANLDDAPPSIPGLPGEPTAAPPDQDASKPAAKPAPGPGEAEPPKSTGNAIYKIDPDGFVTEIFRQQIVIYSMLEKNGILLIGTGNDGEIYQVDPQAQETVVVAKTDAKEVTSLLAGADNRIYLGLSNTGAIAAMTDGYAAFGNFTSPVLDATQVSRLGVMQMHGSLPKGTLLTVSTRSGNIKDPQAQGWSKWTEPTPALEFLRVASPSARFLQYRIMFATTDPAQTPVINDVDVAYQMPHLAPVIKSIKIADAPPPENAAKPGAPVKPAGTASQAITWDTSDADGDALAYSLYFRTTPSGPWILLKDKLTDTNFTWDTKSVADGRYEVKVVASDGLANPPGDAKTAARVSDVLVIDNTPPVIGDIKLTITGQNAKIDLRVTDQTSTVASMDFSLDSSDVWQAVLPADKIFDEPDETVAIAVDHLAPGAHQITLRATDARGNVALQTVSVTVGEK